MPLPWLIGILAAGWVFAALHTAASMRRYGRRFWVWLVICLLCSIIPAAVVSYIDHFRQMRREHREIAAPPRRCPHCGALITGPGREVGGERICDDCGMVVGADDVA